MIRVGRRTFLRGAALVAWPGHLALESRAAATQVAVPHSAGTESPALKAPSDACDCHMHVYDAARFPMVPSQRVPPTQVPPSRLPIAAAADWNDARGRGDASQLCHRE